jgi:hypothetical protein
MATASLNAGDQSITSGAVVLSSPAIESLDYLACLLLELERKAAKAYDEAYRADLPHEALRDKLLGMAADIGTQNDDGSKSLKGSEYEIRLSLGESHFFDPDAVRGFRYALIRHGVAKGMLTDIFKGTVRYSFTESAQRLVKNLALPDHLLAIYEQCRSRTPILTVSPISVARP